MSDVAAEFCWLAGMGVVMGLLFGWATWCVHSRLCTHTRALWL